MAFSSTSSSPSGVPEPPTIVSQFHPVSRRRAKEASEKGFIRFFRTSPTAWKRRRRKEAVQGSGVTFGLLPRFAGLGPLAWAWGFRRRFMAGNRKRPAIGGRELLGRRAMDSKILPEASAWGRSLRLSAHGRLHTCGWAEGSWLPGIVRGEGYRSLP